MKKYFVTCVALLALLACGRDIDNPFGKQHDDVQIVYDGRFVLDLVAPDSVVSAQGLRIDWGRYYQHETHAGTARAATDPLRGVLVTIGDKVPVSIVDDTGEQFAWVFSRPQRMFGGCEE